MKAGLKTAPFMRNWHWDSFIRIATTLWSVKPWCHCRYFWDTVFWASAPRSSSSVYARRQAFACYNWSAVLPICYLTRWHFHSYAFRPLLSPFISAVDGNPLAADCHTQSFTFAHLISRTLKTLTATEIHRCINYFSTLQWLFFSKIKSCAPSVTILPWLNWIESHCSFLP